MSVIIRVLRFCHRLVDEHPDDPIPREWVWGAQPISIGALAAALLLDGVDVRGYDFFVNVLASLYLLGPGLLLTNVIASPWRERRRSERFIHDITMPAYELMGYLSLGLGERLDRLRTWAPSLGAEWDDGDMRDIQGSLFRLRLVLMDLDGVLVLARGTSLAVDIFEHGWRPIRFSKHGIQTQIIKLGNDIRTDMIEERFKELTKRQRDLKDFVKKASLDGPGAYTYLDLVQGVVLSTMDVVEALALEIDRGPR